MASSSPLLSCSILLFLLPLTISGQLSPTQTGTLFRLQRILEFPTSLGSWNNYTSFCYLPKSDNLSISCADNSITEITIVGDRPRLSGSPRNTLSGNFSVDSLFTTLSSIPTLTSLSLVSLGLWGELPPKIDRLKSLVLLNLSSNYLYGQIPNEISSLVSLRSLVLGGNLLKGTVPDMSKMVALEELDLGMNHLGPEWPVTAGRGLVNLVLRNNSFKASIPSELRYMDKLQSLDASSNKLFGPIPRFLFSMPSVRYLDLSGNRLSGAAPVNLACTSGLKFVDISQNKLVGKPPACARSGAANTTFSYSWNCLNMVGAKNQHPNSYCAEEPLAAIMPTANEKKHGSKSKLGLVLGIVGGIVGGAVLVALIFVVVLKKAKPNEGNKSKDSALPKPLSGSASLLVAPRLHSDTRHMSPEVRLGLLGLSPFHEFNMEELEEATNNFDRSNLIQDSPHSQLYRGWIQDGSAVLVRCLKLKQKHSPQSILQYLEAFSKLRHRHLVSVLGHYTTNDQDNTTTVYLVFESVSNGTLRSHLTEWRKREMLKWPQRVAAVIGVARGIQYLHTVSVPGIFGNDLNTESILLDETLTAKISNYNLPMPWKNKNNKVGSEVAFSVLGERNANSMEQGDKEDVYQLGLILLEVITGKPPSAEGQLESFKDQLQRILTESPAELGGLTDPAIHGTFAYESLKTAAETALSCLAQDHRLRPSIDDILWNLQYSVQVQDGCASSENLSTQS